MTDTTPAHRRASSQARPRHLTWANIRLALVALDRDELREWLTRQNRRAPRA